MGYRLPLDSLIDDEAGVLEAQIERSPLEQRGRLPDFHAGVRARHERGLTEPSTRDDHPPRTALCVEARAGRLFVFLPPVSHLEHYLDLVAAVEVAAEALKLPVSLEGYPPPEDPRLRRFLLEPDAGVLRLDLPETNNWDQLQGALSAAYEEAWALGLGTERVSADDGRRLPSGGGGRLTIGGVSPSDSPFLTRPEILRSLVAYWQRHPCLSYLFAGRLIGPSGSAPRPDEGRDEMLYELSIALERLPSGTSDKPWLPDRVLRHLLTDPAGNLKRAEIRVDQLYAPERASSRLGRIMINAFESAPETRLGALQALLVLGLIGRFGRHPDSGELRRWGPALHDRFMLPDVLLDDLRGVIADLVAAGYPFQLDWFEPLFELRFPVLGSVPIGPLTLKLRSAHEPWPLLAEEATARRRGALRRRRQRAPASDALGSASGALCARLQRPPRAAAGDRHARRIHRRRSLQGFEPSGDAAPDGWADPGARVRRHRHLDRARHRRLYLSTAPAPDLGRDRHARTAARGRRTARGPARLPGPDLVDAGDGHERPVLAARQRPRAHDASSEDRRRAVPASCWT